MHDAGALARFGADVQALKASRAPQLPMRVGVMVPTFNRPDLARSCVLQLAHQSRPPDVICVHQNGHPESYGWVVKDLKVAPAIAWLHTPVKLPQHEWYAIPLRYLLEVGCTHFFWADHDDLYLHEHVARGLADLESFDFSVSPNCGLLYTQPDAFKFVPAIDFTSHAPGGMSSTMCFNRAFAQALLADIQADANRTFYTDNIVANVTMKKFRCTVSARYTAVYHSHAGSITSKEWLESELPARG